MKEFNRVVAIRLDEQTLRNIEDFAQGIGLVNEAGDLNISAAIRMLIALGLQEPAPKIEQSLWQSARGSAIHEIVERIHTLVKEYRDEV